MIDTIFALCVKILEVMASILGITYEAINVWIFCVIWPVLTGWLIWMVIKQYKEIKKLRWYQVDCLEPKCRYLTDDVMMLQKKNKALKEDAENWKSLVYPKP